MVVVSVRFTAGGYHATPWGRHVNEGVPEWPPSPWRVLRALIATWRRTMPDVPTAQIERLIKNLTTPPDFKLPRGTVAHTRHYMPWFKKGPSDRTMVFDTFVAVDRSDPLLIIWPEVELDNELTSLLSELLKNLPYLGRSESWCKAELVSGGQANCFYAEYGRKISALAAYEPVRVLAPDENADLNTFLVETNDLRLQQKRLDPPGSRWMLYYRSANAFDIDYSSQQRILYDKEPVIVRYALDAIPLPLVVNALKVGEVARRAVMAQYGRMNDDGRSPTLSGKDADSRPLIGHQHAHYLSTDEDCDGRIDHLTVFASAGFGDREQMALANLSELNFGDGKKEIKLLLLGFSESSKQDELGPLFGNSCVWQSVTPYIMGRHPKTYRTGEPKIAENGYQMDSPEDQILREWQQKRTYDPSLPEIREIRQIPHLTAGGHRFSWLDFRYRRKSGSAPEPVGTGRGFELVFSGQLHGPVSLGYGSHFGLGLFFPKGLF